MIKKILISSLILATLLIGGVVYAQNNQGSFSPFRMKTTDGVTSISQKNLNWRLGIGTTTPSSLLTVDGSFAVGTNGTEFTVDSSGNMVVANATTTGYLDVEDIAGFVTRITSAKVSSQDTTLILKANPTNIGTRTFFQFTDGDEDVIFMEIIDPDIGNNYLSITGDIIVSGKWVGNLTIDAGSAIRSSTFTGNTLLFQAYDVDGGSYTTFVTLTAANEPSLVFNNGFVSQASSTIVGDLTVTGTCTGCGGGDPGLILEDTGGTNYYTASTTGNAYLFKGGFISTASSTIDANLIITGQLSASSTATSTFAQGIDLTDGLGCFAISGTCIGGGGAGGATIELDNLGTVAINTSLISDTDSTDDLGSASKFWANAYIDKVFFEADTFLKFENYAGNNYITGKSDSGGALLLLSQNDTLILHTKKSGSAYGLSIIANSTYGVRLGATKAGSAGHFVIAVGTDIYPETDSSADLGSNTLLWANIYTDLLHLSSTINLDGSETGILKINNADIRPDSDSTRDLGAVDVVAKDQSEEGVGNQGKGFYGALWLGQSFTSGSGIVNISKVETFMNGQFGIPDTVFLDIYLADGNDKPTGASLGQTSIPAMDNTFSWRVFTFSSPITISASTKYVIVISSPDSTDAQIWKANTANPYASGIVVQSTDSGSSWSTISGTDALFRTFTASDFFWDETFTDELILSNDGTAATVANTIRLGGLDLSDGDAGFLINTENDTKHLLASLVGIATTTPTHGMVIVGGLCIDNGTGDCGSMVEDAGSATTTGNMRVIGTLDSSDITFRNLVDNEVIFTLTEGDRVGEDKTDLVLVNMQGENVFIFKQDGTFIARDGMTSESNYWYLLGLLGLLGLIRKYKI